MNLEELQQIAESVRLENEKFDSADDASQCCGTSVLAGRARNLIPSRALGTDGTGRSMRNFEDGPVPRPAVRRAQAHATTSSVNQQP